KVAEQLALLLNPGDVITLEGELGVGKTIFAKGIARGLGVKQAVTSPTFTIVKEYEGELPLYHMDAYRLEHSDEDIGFDEYFYGNGISVVEWAQFIEDYLPNHTLNVHIQYVDDDTRLLTFTPIGNHYEKIIGQLSRS
ncbi:MAG TPA: tRNA (adenosine(37)-N6)-threonylcarbamoyltransferase complex ATPase subunit type 1 TsaE, partial [Virgibacillus sp.]|nr:tRNA (adenosine(37)-N6)-threonylcarbamoyltransferase complex ATPase subunit type 1 TsaE [Virgibacillus sp.]